ncbi:MAG TPA: phospholipase A [Gammaproteobacteria bacterium]|nr:phospholipase A [Gammaproteobacteria bacterium]
MDADGLPVVGRDCSGGNALKTWWRIPEDDSKDDNPDIDDYMGYFELLNAFTYKKHSLNIMLRNNLRSDMQGAKQVDWGYGERLIDYNHIVNSIRIGGQPDGLL